MGAYYIFVNTTKEEYLDPSVFYDGIKSDSMFGGLHSFALRALFQENDQRSLSGSSRLNSWSGDSFHLTSDEDSRSNELVKAMTNKDNEGNLYWYAKESYKNISNDLFNHLLLVDRGGGFLEELYSNAQQNDKLFCDLVNRYYESRNPKLLNDLESVFGSDWPKKYSKLVSV